MFFFALLLPLLSKYDLVYGSKHISNDELKALSENLFKNDDNNVAQYVTMHLQGRSRFNSSQDMAPNTLFTLDNKIKNIKTISKVFPLYDNYDVDAFHNEVITPAETKEEVDLLNSILNTTVMTITKNFLRSKGLKEMLFEQFLIVNREIKYLVPKSDSEFFNYMKTLWFSVYSRTGKKKGSSAFEHTFLGEIKNSQVSGLHNWIYFSHLESKKQLNYLGWIKKVDFPQQRGAVVKLKYAWNNLTKPVGTLFVGTSPEFEMALYTVCFIARPNDKCGLSIGGQSVQIQTYAFSFERHSLISSAYPNI